MKTMQIRTWLGIEEYVWLDGALLRPWQIREALLSQMVQEQNREMLAEIARTTRSANAECASSAGR